MLSVVHLTQLAVPHLEKTKGNIVNVSSIGAVRPFAQLMYYCMAKAAVDHFTRSMATLLAGTGVRVNGVKSVGLTWTYRVKVEFLLVFVVRLLRLLPRKVHARLQSPSHLAGRSRPVFMF